MLTDGQQIVPIIALDLADKIISVAALLDKERPIEIVNSNSAIALLVKYFLILKSYPKCFRINIKNKLLRSATTQEHLNDYSTC